MPCHGRSATVTDKIRVYFYQPVNGLKGLLRVGIPALF